MNIDYPHLLIDYIISMLTLTLYTSFLTLYMYYILIHITPITTPISIHIHTTFNSYTRIFILNTSSIHHTSKAKLTVTSSTYQTMSAYIQYKISGTLSMQSRLFSYTSARNIVNN